MLRDAAWHITTLLNTFNTYYCFDIHYDHPAEIDPIWLLLKNQTATGLVRLMAITIHIETDSNNDTFWFWICSDTGTMTILTHDVLTSLSTVYTERRGGFEPIQEIDTYQMINYTARLVGGKKNFYMPPIYNTFEYGDEGSGWDEPDGLETWYPNFKHISKARILSPPIVKREHVSAPFATQSKDDNISTEYRDQLIAYLFGADLLYLEENFSEDEYTPTTRIAWDQGIETMMKNRGLMDSDDMTGFFPYNKVNVQELRIHDDYDYRQRIIKEITRFDTEIHAYDTIVTHYMLIMNDIINGTSKTSRTNIRRFYHPKKDETHNYPLLSRDALEHILYIKKTHVRDVTMFIDEAMGRINRLLL